MAPLERELRKRLGEVVGAARVVAQDGATKALQMLAVGAAEPHAGMTEPQKALRNRLRAHGRQLGDTRQAARGTQDIEHLAAECAYEHWHRMLFARFLLEAQLLLEPDSGVAISFDEVKALAQERGQDWAGLAGAFAVRMLPQVFRQDDPVLEVQFAPEDRKGLEDLLVSLPAGVFTGDDSLGWTYQFWQAKERDAINESGEKIGADTLGPVTQLFTDHYMVEFLLHNTLGAWWAGRVLAERPELAANASSEDELRVACAAHQQRWAYLRFVRGDDQRWRPAAGTFDGWPKTAKEITVLDPCMGSGHFLISALLILAALRATEEGLARQNAIFAVLRDNLAGLELDARCTQIAAFNLALAAWRVVGYESLPPLRLACAGVGPNVSEHDWVALAGKDERMRGGMARLHALFGDAPALGSLINPRVAEGDLLTAAFHELEPLLGKALAQEAGDEAAHEMAVFARGLAKAGEILAGRFTLVATNVPYLGRQKQGKVLLDYCTKVHPQAKGDLATCFVERCLAFCSAGGTTALVTPQNWLFLTTYKKLRSSLLGNSTWNVLGRLGDHAFQSITGDVVRVVLLTLTNSRPTPESQLSGIEVSSAARPELKDTELPRAPLVRVHQLTQLRNPDSRITFNEPVEQQLLSRYAQSLHGQSSFDSPCFTFSFWELAAIQDGWVPQQTSPTGASHYTGCSSILRWEDGRGMLARLMQEKARSGYTTGAWRAGVQAWKRPGVVVSLMQRIVSGIYCGSSFDDNVAVITPFEDAHVLPILAFCESGEFEGSVRAIDQKLNVPCNTLAKVPFDLDRWQKAAAENYPDGLPKPSSNDPTQWLFGGTPDGSSQPLQVALARLVGYRWPRQTGTHFVDCPGLGPDRLMDLADTDGIVSLSAGSGEAAATERLREMLARAYGKDWNAALPETLLAQTGNARMSLEDWLCDAFFEQHCALFLQRPFVWHIWDGERDGFQALVNYHMLAARGGNGRKTLEKLTYAVLGDWIGRYKAEQKQGKEGADTKVAAATHLQEQLKKIVRGDPPYDIFVRWKPLHEQAIGWEPDLNDGVRMNIRPFMTATTLRGKSIFRKAPRIAWDKDRGKEPKKARYSYPWLWSWDEGTQDFTGGREFDGNRWNALHYSIEMKQHARADV